MHNGSPVEMPWLSKVKGVLEAYLGGQAVGEAVSDILYGKACHAENWQRRFLSNFLYLSFGDGENVTYQEGIFVGYRYYDTKKMPVAFPFGYGLSYTSFSYDHLRIDKTESTDHDIVTVSVDVTNTGNVEGCPVRQRSYTLRWITRL